MTKIVGVAIVPLVKKSRIFSVITFLRQSLIAVVALLFLPTFASVDASQKTKSKPTTNQVVSTRAKSKKNKFSYSSIFEKSSEKFVCINEIDEIILRNLKAKGISPAKCASEAVMLRRVYLDLTGTIPTAQEAKDYLDDKSSDKYIRLVHRLLASDNFNIYMTMRLGDMLRIKSEFPINLWPNAAQAFTRYIYNSVAKNKSWRTMVEEMLTSSGSNFRVGQVNFYRAMQARNPENFASMTALSFMGLRFDSMTKKQKDSLVNFFRNVQLKSTKEWKEEIVFDAPLKRDSFISIMPDGSCVVVRNSASARRDFTRWLVAKNNPFFAKSFANRVWGWLFGRGIIMPVDNLNGENSNPELIGYLAYYFAENNFDIRKLFEHIVLSRTYALSSIPVSDAKKSVSNFASYPVRQSEAEVIIDMVCKITGRGEIYESTTPEPYTLMPKDTRAVSLYDSGITTSFLELFGRSARDTGYFSERVNEPSPSQRLHFLNSSHIRKKLIGSKNLSSLIQSKTFFTDCYLTVLSRYPVKAEIEIYRNIKTSKNYSFWNKRQDLIWTLFNSEEFFNRH